MTKPEMILFDYGHTLAAEPGYDSLRGTAAVMRHTIHNPQNLTTEQVDKFSADLFFGICGQVRELGAEIHEMQFQRLMYEYLQIEFDVSLTEIELIYWDNAAPGEAMPYASELLKHLKKNGTRTGVISNIGFSGHALITRLNRLLPDNCFEFVIASSEYMIRKPNPMLFELALRKANLEAKDVWFCGDSPTADIVGASSVGIYPVWYEDLMIENPFREKNSKKLDCEHLHIHDWQEMIAFLEMCEDA